MHHAIRRSVATEALVDGRRGRRAVRAVFVALAAVWTIGFVVYLRASSTVTVALPPLAPHPADEHDVAAARFGPTIRVSSYFADVYNQHHPAFLVDERRHPTRVEKWASDPHDAHPWIEIRWRGAHDISHVEIEHAGTVEDQGMTARTYSLTCLVATGRGPTLAVVGNTDAVARHVLQCRTAVGLRIDFVPDVWDGMVRIFEVVAWGR
jgi:hypothetical protein